MPQHGKATLSDVFTRQVFSLGFSFDEETEEINIRETLILTPFEPKRKLKTTNVLITIGLGLALLVTLYFFVRDFSQLFSYSNPLAGKPQTVVEKRPKLLRFTKARKPK